MNFIAPFLIGLAAFTALPVIFHLIRRKRVQVLELPTLRYLRKAALKQRFHLRLQDHLLLLLRVLVLLLLAAAFAGPITEGSLDSDYPAIRGANVLVIDDSLSMSFRESENENRFDEAGRIAEAIFRTREGESWRAMFLSEIESSEDPLAQAATDLDSLQAKLEKNASPEHVAPAGILLQQLSQSLGEDSGIWFISDAAASNWEKPDWIDSPNDRPIEVMEIGGPVSPFNWSIRDLSLNNQPLLEDEPALITLTLDGGSDPVAGKTPTAVRYGWRNLSSQSGGGEFNLPPLAAGDGLRFEETLPLKGVVTSVTAELHFGGEGDPLPGDDRIEIVPETLKDVQITLLAETDEWLHLVESALVGFSVESKTSTAPPQSADALSAGFIVILGRESPDPGWISVLQNRVESGAGMLVLYDSVPESLRNAVWSEWWNRWERRFTAEWIAPGENDQRSGGNPWFYNSLDSSATRIDRAEEGLTILKLGGVDSEWELIPMGGGAAPLFQTFPRGRGTVASFNLPISPRETSLLLSPGWVPLVSQMVKRTLIEVKEKGPSEVSGWRRLESDLAKLSPQDAERLEKSGWRIWSAADALSDIENLPSNRQDWTALLLVICLLLAFIEIGVSNYA